MKVKTLSALAGLGGALILSSSADAAYVGLSIVLVNSGVTVPGAQGGVSDVYRVYANFTNPGDSVYFWGGSPLTSQATIHSGGGTFRNVGGGGGNTAPYSAGTRDWETYATIGVRYGSEGGASTPAGDGTSAAPGTQNFILTSTGGLTDTWTTSPLGGGYFVTPDDTQGRADFRVSGEDTNLTVLLAQLSVPVGSLPTGSGIRIEGRNADGSLFGFSNQAFAVPGPGALALLGLAGLVGTRRRRA